MKSDRVCCYYNLRKRCLSIQRGRKVVKYTHYICLENVKFIVQPSGRRRVLETGQKNVHAFAEGEEVTGKVTVGSDWQRVSYNPFVSGSFYLVETKEKVTAADIVIIDNVVWALGAK